MGDKNYPLPLLVDTDSKLSLSWEGFGGKTPPESEPERDDNGTVRPKWNKKRRVYVV